MHPCGKDDDRDDGELRKPGFNTENEAIRKLVKWILTLSTRTDV
jgi:hypothetical protein